MMRLAALLLIACGSETVTPIENPPAQTTAAVKLAITNAEGEPLKRMRVGDAVRVKVTADGVDLPYDQTYAFSLPLIEAADEGVELPATFFLQNPARPDVFRALSNTLFALEAGTVMLTATVSNAGKIATKVVVEPMPEGDPSNGAELYAKRCAGCHGAAGYGKRAPGLNAFAGNFAAEHGAQRFALAVRAAVDARGKPLSAGMPAFEYTTDELADMYAFLQSKHDAVVGIDVPDLVAGDAVKARAVLVDGEHVQDVPSRGYKVTLQSNAFVTNDAVAELVAGTLFPLIPGAINVSVTVEGPISGAAQKAVVVGYELNGDVTRGAQLWTDARCGGCHGKLGEGKGETPALRDWTPAALAYSARTLLTPDGTPIAMPSFLERKNAATLELLTTQDFADLSAWLQAQR